MSPLPGACRLYLQRRTKIFARAKKQCIPTMSVKSVVVSSSSTVIKSRPHGTVRFVYTNSISIKSGLISLSIAVPINTAPFSSPGMLSTSIGTISLTSTNSKSHHHQQPKSTSSSFTTAPAWWDWRWSFTSITDSHYEKLPSVSTNCLISTSPIKLLLTGCNRSPSY